MHYVLTIYQDDDTTPLLEVGTAPDHPAPYLHVPQEMDLGEIDLLRGRAMIGQVNVRVIDPQTGPTQAERWVTERLGVPSGPGAGHSALNGRRAILQQVDGRLVIDGVVWGVQLSDSAAGFHLQIRDVRERARKIPLFRRTGTSSVLPRGVIDGYGRLPSGGWLVPPTQPLTASVVSSGGLIPHLVLDLTPHHWSGGRADPRLTLTDAVRAATRVVANSGFWRTNACPDVTLLWRYRGAVEWQELRAPIPAAPAGLFHIAEARLRGADDGRVTAIRGIGLSPLFQSPLPSSGQGPVELILRYDGEPSEAYPYHFEGTAGELIQAVLRGDYSEEPLRMRYDEAAVLALETPVRLRITEPVEDARPWIEQLHQQLGAAPALDSQGRLSPVLAEIPPATDPLPVIDGSTAQPIPGWEHPADGAVTSVAVKYQRDYLVRAIDDPLGERSAGDGISSIDVTVEHVAPQWARDLMGDHPLEIDGWLYRAIGGAEGDPVTGDVINEDGAQASRRLGHLFIDRHLFGGQTSFVRVQEAEFEGLREGSWVIDERPWRPNYREGKRGGQTLAQVVSIRAAAPGWLDLRLVDAGPLDQPLAAPAIGTLAISDTGGVEVPVTTVPSGAEVAVYYAIASSAPSDDGSWIFAGRVSETGVVETPPVPAGAEVWVRARSEAPGRRPSGWTAVRQITMPIVPRVSGVRVEIDDDGEALVRWEPNPHTAGVRIYYAVRDPDSDPDEPIDDYIDREGSDLSAELPVTVPPLMLLQVLIEPWSGWTGSAVSGTAGPRISVSEIASPEGMTGIRWRGEHLAPPPDPRQHDAYRNTVDGIVYIYIDGEWEVLVRDGEEGPQGPAGASVEVRYSGPTPGANISATFAPGTHLYMQTRRTDQSWPSEWARIVGEDGTDGEDGGYTDYRFRAAATQPATPTGPDPSGWSDAPPTPGAGEYLWMSRAQRHADGTLVGTWSTPVRLTGPQGPEGPPGPPGTDYLPPVCWIEPESYEELTAQVRIHGRDWEGSSSGLEYQYRTYPLDSDGVGDWGDWSPIPPGGAPVIITIPTAVPTVLEAMVRDAEERESAPVTWLVYPRDIGGARQFAVDEMEERGLEEDGFRGVLKDNVEAQGNIFIPSIYRLQVGTPTQLQKVQKVLRVPHTAGVAAYPDDGFVYDDNLVHPADPGSANALVFGVVLPAGATITKVRAICRRVNTQSAVEVNFLRVDPDGTPVNLADVVHDTTGWADLEQSLNELVTDGTYTVRCLLESAVVNTDTALRRVEIEYEVADYLTGI